MSSHRLTSNWRRAGRCATESACVEVRTERGSVAVRDAEFAPSGAVLVFSGPAWTAFVAGV